MTATEEFDAARPTAERQKNYGHPLDDFAAATLLKNAVLGCNDALIRHVLEMIGVKMARLTYNPYHVDSWIDIAGYARTACMVMDERARRHGRTGEEPV